MDPLGRSQAAARPGAGPVGGPPAPAEGRRGHEAEHGHVVVDERDQGRPGGHPADEVVGAVDRVDDPAPGAVAGGLELLALDGVAGPGALELDPDQLLGRLVGVADQREVGLGLHDEVVRPEPGHRDPLDGVRQDMGKAQVVVIGHLPTLARRRARTRGPARRPAAACADVGRERSGRNTTK